MKERTKAYLAGLVDADGRLSICRHVGKETGYVSYTVAFSVANTSISLMKWLVKTFGGEYKEEKDARLEDNEKWNQCYGWYPTSNTHASRILSVIAPYLVIKRNRAKLCKKFFELNGTVNPNIRKTLYTSYKQVLSQESVTPNTSSISWKKNILNAYIAGFFDGEGSLGIYETKQSEYSRGSGVWYKPRISAGNSVKRIPKIMQKTYGGGLVSFLRSKDRKWEHTWSLSTNKPIERFLLKMVPYLIAKKEQAKLLLSFVRLGLIAMPEGRCEIAHQLSQFKK